jgi:aminopeptidase-like protein
VAYVNANPKCEPQLGRRGLYRTAGGLVHQPGRELALLWVLNYSDGRHSLLDIAERAGIGFPLILSAARDLIAAGLLAERAEAARAGRWAPRPATSTPIPALEGLS